MEKKFVLMVEYVDDWRRLCAAQAGIDLPATRRYIEIQLTEDQQKKLQPIKLGSSGVADVLEQLGHVTLQETN